ncbi:MAG: hypothetical protein LAQ69_25550 [Acidobacteriia bacterium]|nr:hypothetical protein [Terriglobia bacterium]
MATSGIIGEEIDKQGALASAALQNISGVGAGTSARHLLPRAVLDMLGPYSAALYIAERVVQSDVFDVELVQILHSKLLPLERMADDVLAATKQRGYFDDPDTAEPLRWLETCNEQVKDCMVALESMLDPQLDDLMAAAIEEHQRGETVPLDSIR